MALDIVLDTQAVSTDDKELEAQADKVLEEVEQLTPEEKKKVEEFSKKIDISNNDIVMNYGATIQKQSTAITSSTLREVKTKNTGDAGKLMVEMVAAMDGMEGGNDNGGLITKLYKKVKLQVKGFAVSNQNAEKTLDRIEKQLEGHGLRLEADINKLEDIYESNWEVFKALTLYIKAADLAMDKATNETLVELKEKAALSGNPEDAMRVSDFEGQIDEFSKQVQNLRLTRTICLQTAPQIRMLQRSNMAMSRKLKSSIVNTIPLWKNKIAMSIMLENNKKAVEAQNALDDATNRMLKEQAQQFHIAVTESAKASQRGIVDMDTIETVNNEIVSAVSDYIAIEQQGRRDREQAVQVLAGNEKKLITGILTETNKTATPPKYKTNNKH